MTQVDVAIVGGGALGLACARAIAPRRDSVVVFEGAHLGAGISGRNSGVVHAGLHGPPQSLKRRLAIEGNPRLWALCEAHGVPHRRSGKLVVATSPDEVPRLEAMFAQARACGVPGLRLRSAAELRRDEPALRGVAALHSATSGTFDVSALLHVLRAQARAAGALVLEHQHVSALHRRAGGFVLHVDHSGSERDEVFAAQVVNAAGFGAPALMHRVAERRASVTPWKGHYFVVAPEVAATVTIDLVYPMPVPGGLGTHLTRTPSGETWLGPDARRAAHERDLDVPATLAESFAADARRYLPALRTEHLRPAFAGLRPKLNADGSFADFVVHEEPAGCVHLLGIESPGLTASLPLADLVASRLG